MRNKERLSEERWSVQCAVRGGREARGAVRTSIPCRARRPRWPCRGKRPVRSRPARPPSAGSCPAAPAHAHAQATRTSRLHVNVYVYEIRVEQHDCRSRRAECSQRTSHSTSADEMAGTRAGRERLRQETRVATDECSPLKLIRTRRSTATLLYSTRNVIQ